MSSSELRRINGVGRKKAQILRQAGYYTIEDISKATINELTKVKGIGRKTAFSLKMRSRSLVEQRILPLDKKIALFPRDQLILIDIETDLYVSYVWAICAQLSDGTIKQWYAPRKAGSGQIIEEFNEWLEELLEENERPVLGSWSSFDFNVLSKVGSSNLRSTFKKFILVDFLAEVKKNYAFPISSFSLKPISAFLGYKYAEDGMDGLQAASTYMHFESLGGLPYEVKEKLLQYNKDDVLAMAMVLDQTLYNVTKNGL